MLVSHSPNRMGERKLFSDTPGVAPDLFPCPCGPSRECILCEYTDGPAVKVGYFFPPGIGSYFTRSPPPIE